VPIKSYNFWGYSLGRIDLFKKLSEFKSVNSSHSHLVKIKDISRQHLILMEFNPKIDDSNKKQSAKLGTTSRFSKHSPKLKSSSKLANMAKSYSFLKQKQQIGKKWCFERMERSVLES
jgi:hypothetical protein